MFESKKSSLLKPVKKMIVIVGIAVFLLLGCIAFLQRQSSNQEHQDKIVINVLGKQGMHTQMISKDASRQYALMQAQEIGAFETAEVVDQKIQESKQNLRQARADFLATLLAMQKGYLQSGTQRIDIGRSLEELKLYLTQIDRSWKNFDQEILVLIGAEKIDENVAQAIIYINDNNLELLDACDRITELILEDSIETTRQREYGFYAMIGILSCIIIFAMVHLFRYLIIPFHQLYKGIAEMGLSNRPYVATGVAEQEVPLVSEINQMFEKINSLISLIENMNNNSSFMETLNFINATFSSFIPYSYIGVALIDTQKNQIRASYGVSDGTIKGIPEGLIGKSIDLKGNSLERLIQTGETRIINDLEAYTANKPMKSYNKIILKAGIKASITLPLKVLEEPVGVIFFSSKKKNVYNEEHVRFLKTLVNSIAVSFNQNIFINDLLYSSTLALAKLAEARDEDTGEHLDRMKLYARAIAECLYKKRIYTKEISLEYIEMIERFSPLHDIGKVGIRDGILLKPGKLTTEEFDEMKKHTTYGAKVLSAAESNISKSGKKLFELGIEIAESHHEKWDGSGYPFGKRGEEIPLSARIVAVADVFDALTSKRPYKEAFPFEESFEIIVSGSGAHFDPKIVESFKENKKLIFDIYKKSNPHLF